MTVHEENEFSSKNHEKKVQRKQKRFQQLILKDSGIKCCDQPSRNLVVCNAGLSTGLEREALIAEFGDVHDVHMLRNKSYCFVVCADLSAAVKIYSEAHAKCRLGQNDTVIYLSYCETVPAVNLEDSSQQSLPPGLIILPDFITEDEENKFINLVNWNEVVDQTNTLKHRQVKHYGYEFRYDTNSADALNPLTDSIPEECNLLWTRLQSKCPDLKVGGAADQLTINKYEIGQGIPYHVDTHSAFTDIISSLSLASDIVMEFRKPRKNNSKEYESYVSVTLPRRSLLILTGESRYGWKHGIVPRKIDVVRNANGCLTAKNRSMRISYTFRWLSSDDCNCEFHSICDTALNRMKNKSTTKMPIENPFQCELENVHKIYNEIANHFSETRHSPWPQVKQFIDDLPIGSVLVDIGCGNGKYLSSNSNRFGIGCDRSDGLLKVCRERQLNVFQCDCLAVPIKSDSIDGCISIAVIHHLASEERRVQAISEMIRILRIGGKALIYVWAKNQELKTKSSYLRQNKKNNRKPSEEKPTDDDSHEPNQIDSNQISNFHLPIHTNRTQFEHTDVLVPWKLKNSTSASTVNDSDGQSSKTFLRYYHVFEEFELENICKQFKEISIEKSYYDQGNWCVILQKK